VLHHNDVDLVRVTRTLSPESAEAGYRQGLFPMAESGLRCITWHRPPVRAIIPLDGFHLSHSLARRMRGTGYQVTFNREFENVMRACAERKPTWITEELIGVYVALHRAGKAHSVEVWVKGHLSGGVYGVHLGAAFFAESMFHRVTDMSKIALARLTAHLRECDFHLLEVQYLTSHLASLGAVEIPHKEYMTRLQDALAASAEFI
jgi:leucyl/phenylalanyl-tRNA--protein transferase